MGIVELCQCKESSIDFFAGALYMGKLIPIISFLASVSCLSNLQTPPLYPEPPNEPVSLSDRPQYPDLRRNSHPHRESRSPQRTKTGSSRP